MGRKNANRDKDYDEVQKLKQENKQLRTRVRKLHKVIKNIDIEHYKFVQDLLNSQNFNEEGIVKTKSRGDMQKELEMKWLCFDCEKGIMRLTVINKAGEPHYFRRCEHCDKKTKMKKYTSETEGV